MSATARDTCLLDCVKQQQITFREYSWFVHAIIRTAACGGIVDQLHEGKGFFLLFLMRKKKYCPVCFALCLKIISHFLEYIELQVNLESKNGLRQKRSTAEG